MSEVIDIIGHENVNQLYHLFRVAGHSEEGYGILPTLLALRAALDAQAGVTVKPLVWRQQSPDCHVAHAVLGDTAVQSESHALAPDRWGWWAAGSAEDDSPSGYAVTIEVAKAAAQADYTARILSALEPIATPLAEVAMRERSAKQIMDHGEWMKPHNLVCNGFDFCGQSKAIRALPTTATHSELLAAAMQLPEVNALVDAADDLLSAINAKNKFGDRSLTITGNTANLKWLIGAEDEARAALAPFTRKGE